MIFDRSATTPLGMSPPPHFVAAGRSPGWDEDFKNKYELDADVRSEVRHLAYVDNFASFSLVQVEAALARDEFKNSLESSGVPVHDVTSANLDLELPGRRLAKGRVIHPLNRRRWRVMQACRWARTRGYLTGRELLVIVSHFTAYAILRRETLCILSACYAFMEKHWDKHHKLWPSVLRELQDIEDITPLVRRELIAPWHSRVGVRDASLWGAGVVVTSLSPHEVGEVGRVNERWRYRRGSLGEEAARARSLSLLSGAPCLTVLPARPFLVMFLKESRVSPGFLILPSTRTGGECCQYLGTLKKVFLYWKEGPARCVFATS